MYYYIKEFFEGGNIMNEQKKGILKKSSDYLKYSGYLKGKSIFEKKMIICQSKNPTLVEQFLTNYEDMIECYANIYQNNHKEFLRMLYNLLMRTQDDNLKYKYVNQLKDDKNKLDVIMSINNLFIRGCALQYLDEEYHHVVFKTIQDKELLIKIYYKIGDISVLCAIDDDAFKQYCLNDWNVSGQVRIIQSFEDDELKYYYAKLPVYRDYFKELTLSLKGLKYKAEMFKNCTNLHDKLTVLSKIDSLEEFNHLLRYIPMSFYRQAFELSKEQNKNSIINCMELPNRMVDTNGDLSFVVEFEIDITYCKEMNNFEHLLGNWKVQHNRYNRNLVKITSPKLKYSENGFKELKIMCDLLRNNNCYPYNNSAMKIKFNCNYFKTVDEFIKFLMLYTYSEPLINNLCNRAGAGFRKDKSIPFYYLVNYLSKVGADFSHDGLRKIINKINGYMTTDNYSLNLLENVNKEQLLEFRMADVELDFNELYMTIVLFGKLLEKAKLISNLDRKNLALNGNNRREKLKANCILLRNCLMEKQSLGSIYRILNMLNIKDINECYPIGKEVSDPAENLEGLLKVLFEDEIERKRYRTRYLANRVNNNWGV